MGSLLAALLASVAFVVAHSINDTTVVSVALSPHAIPDRPGFIPHDPRFCISPPPFGKQCTMHATDTTVVSLMEWATTKAAAANSAARRLPGIAPQMRRAAAC